METIHMALLGLVGMFVLMAIGMPIAFAMLLAGAAGIASILSFSAATHLVSTTVWDQFSSYSLSVIPLFVLMGQLAFRSGITERLYAAAYSWLGRAPGGLASSTIVASAGFSTICGSNAAASATMGMIALPEMKRYGYSRALSAGAVAVGGTLGAVIPPSVVMIVIGIQTEQSILALFLAGIVPGILLTVLFIATIAFMCWRDPSAAPKGPATTLKEKLVAGLSVLETLALFSFVIGGLYAGLFTPTEAGATGAFGALVIGLVRRGLTIPRIIEAVMESLRISAMVIMLITAAVVFGRFLTLTRLPSELAAWVTSLPVSPDIILVAILLIYLIGGAFVDALGFLVVTLPIFFPLSAALGFDPIWFSMMLVIVTTIGSVSPPVGVNVFVVSALAPDIKIGAIFKNVFYFFFSFVLCVALIWLYPDTVLYLPRMLQ
ncbi:MAG: C4-dicarboxylate ABC transporter permease [Alcaligenaceae bacterium]|nr:C4-dicarboxylate ABC transporter permease [Alcaligenaceae bacterium]